MTKELKFYSGNNATIKVQIREILYALTEIEVGEGNELSFILRLEKSSSNSGSKNYIKPNKWRDSQKQKALTNLIEAMKFYLRDEPGSLCIGRDYSFNFSLNRIELLYLTQKNMGNYLKTLVTDLYLACCASTSSELTDRIGLLDLVDNDRVEKEFPSDYCFPSFRM